MVTRPSPLALWLAPPFIVFALAVGTIYAHSPLALLALGIAYVPDMAASNLTYGNPRTRFELRAGLHLLSALAIGGILIAQHSALPVWVNVFATLLAVLSLVTATVLLMAAWRRAELRR